MAATGNFAQWTKVWCSDTACGMKALGS